MNGRVINMGEVVRIEYELVWLRDRGRQYLYLTQCKVDVNGSVTV